MRPLKRPPSSAAIVAIACSCLLPLSGALAQGPAGAPPPARADGDAGAKAEARTHFERGVQLGHAGDYRQAAAEFQQAYQLSPHYAVLYNLAQAQIAIGQSAEAVDTLQRYLTDGGANVPADRRAEVQATIKQQQARVSTLVVDANVAGATILVDGVSMGRSPLSAPLRVARGKHQVTAELKGYRVAPQTVAAEEKAHVSLSLERVPVSGVSAGAAGPGAAPAPTASVNPAPAAGPEPSHPPVPGPAPQPESPSPLLTQSPGSDADQTTSDSARRSMGFVIGGIGVAMGAAALGCYLWNKSRFDDYEAARVNDPGKAGSIRTVSAVTVGLAIGGAALAATGAVLVLTTPAHQATQSNAGGIAGSAVAIGPAGISWRGTW